MKKIIIMVMIVGLTIVSQADFFVNAFSSFGIYDATGSTGILPNVGDTALIQLIYAGADGVANESAPGILDIALGLNLLTGDDEFLGSVTFQNTGGLFEDYAASNFGSIQASYVGTGFVYMRIFDASNPVAGDNYYISAVQFAADKIFGGTPPPPDLYNIGGGLDLQAATGSVIPEPATLGMMAVAGLGMFLARKKARR